MARSSKKQKDKNLLLLLGGAGALALLLGGGDKKASASSSTSTTSNVPPKVNTKPGGGAGTSTPSRDGLTPAQIEELDRKEIEDALRKAAEKKDGEGSSSSSSTTPAKTSSSSSTSTSSTSAPGKGSTTSTEPTSSKELVSSLAQRFAANVRANKYNYSRSLCKSFQAMATGLAIDGIYGGATYNALKFYGVKTPPAALFKPSPSVSPYKPAS